MMRTNKKGWTGLVAGLSALLLAACSSPTMPSHVGGSLVINLPSLSSAGRTILPDFSSQVKITATVSASGYSSQTLTQASTGTITFHGLNTATWAISIVVANESGTTIGTGSASTAVSSGSSASISIPITFSGSTSGTGTLSIPLSWTNSVGVDYLSWNIDGGAATTASGASTTVSATLTSGVHTLFLSFQKGGSGGTPAGTFVESVNIWSGMTSNSWIDGTGTVQSTMSFAATNFLDSNANLGGAPNGLTVQDSSSSGATQTIGFSSTTYSYNFTTIPASNSIVFTPESSIDGQAISYTWNGGTATPITSGSTSTTLAFSTASDDNTLNITVTAADGSTHQTYTLTWSRGDLAVGVSSPTLTYQALSFADNTPTITQGQDFTVESNNATLTAQPNWSWTVNGATQSSISANFEIPSGITATMLGTYDVVGTVSYNGVTYSGNATLTVNRSGSLNIPRTNPPQTQLVSGLSFSYGVAYVNSLVYIGDAGTASIPGSHLVLSINPISFATTVIAGGSSPGNADGVGMNALFQGPGAIATDGTHLFVIDGPNNNIREITIATGQVTTLAGSTNAPSGTAGYADGTGTAALFNDPTGLWTDGTTLYVVDRGNYRIRKIDIASGEVTTLAGSSSETTQDGTGTNASFDYPYGVTSDGSYLYITEFNSGAVRRLELSNNEVTTIYPAGSINIPSGIVYAGGALYLTESGNSGNIGYIDQLTLSGTLTRLISGLNYPKAITTDGTNIYFADTDSGRIVELSP